jgi:hypothetical protein
MSQLKIGLSIALLGGCLGWQTLAASGPVRNLDTRQARDVQLLAGRARQIASEVYPQIVDLLGGGKSETPRGFDIVFREHLIVSSEGAGQEWTGCTSGQTISLNAGFLRERPEILDYIMVHEMTHVAQNYPPVRYHGWRVFAYIVGFKASHPFAPLPRYPLYWTEGIADYACAKLGHTNVLNCPECDQDYLDYHDGYKCAAAFLLYIDSTYGAGVVRGLNAAIREGFYEDRFFKKETGRSLDELWSDFRKTSAYTPVAADLNELHQALAYKAGKPPKEINARLQKYFALHPDIKETYEMAARWPQMLQIGPQSVIEFIIYHRHQPNGERILQSTDHDLNELHQALGFQNGKPPGDLRERSARYLEAHPDTKEFLTANGLLKGPPSADFQRWIEQLILERMQPDWKINESAGEFLYKLKHQGGLPGWGRREIGKVFYSQRWAKDVEAYPVSRTFEAQKQGRKELYFYTVAQDSPDGPWKLRRAWETTAKGRLVKDFAVQ